jgi:hypothetical protein
MGTKPGIALIGLGLAAILSSGCESSAACRPKTVSAWQTSTPSGYPASAVANQTRTTTGNPVAAMGPANPSSQSARITDPSMSSASTPSALSQTSSQSVSSMASPTGSTPAASQTPASFPALPSSQTSTAGVDQSSRMINPATTQSSPPQPPWPSTIPAAGATAVKQADPPPINTSQTGETSYQTRYPQLQSSPSVPTMPKAGQSGND